MKTLLRTLLLSWLPFAALAGSTASISGRVTALDGTTPISGVQVFAFLNGSQVPSSPFTDGNGNYTITGLDTGNYNVGFINPASGQGPQTYGANPVQISVDGQSFLGVNKSMAGALTVWSTSDTGTGSLRQRLTAAQGLAGANTVDFDPSLSGQTISITTPLTISDTAGVTLDFSTINPAGATTLAGDFGLSGTASVFLKAPPAGRQLNIPGTLALGNNFLTVTGNGSLVFSGSLNNGTLLLGGLLGGTMSVTLQGSTGNSSFTASVSSGSLLLAKNNAGGSAPAISANLIQTGGTVTFGGTGNQVAPTAQSAELQTGSGPAFVLTAASTALPNLGWAPGGTVRCALDNAGGPAKLAITGALAKTAGTGAFTFDFQNSGSPGQTYTLATFASSTFAAADFTATGLFPGLTGTFAKTGTTLTFTLAAAPNAYQVSNLSDSGAGSLRNVLAFAASQAGSNTVTFASNLSGQTISVQSELVVNDAGGVAIDASALPAGITLSGGNARRILHTAAGTALTLRRITFTQGNGVGSDGAGGSNGVSGGALRNLGTLHAVDCAFTGNQVANNGGAFANAAGATATLLGCTFTNNQTTGGAANGGAITNGGTLLTLRRCTLSGNSNAAFAGNAASAIFNSAPLILEHCTIAGNTSSSSGGIDAGIYNLYSVGASYCILSGNTGLDVYNDNAAPFGSPTSLSGVNILVNAGGIAIGGTGTRLISDPLLAALASNGGPTQTRSIPTNSPARNAGTGSTATVDQRGFAMVGVPDLGAYEAGAAAASTISDIANLSINEDAATSALAFTLGDTVVSPANLTVTGGSSNTTLVPLSNIVFGGSGASRTVTVTPAANQFGTATITVTVGGGSSAASDSFVLTVNPVNDAPFPFSFPTNPVSIPRDTNTGDISFTIGDVETAAASLTLTKSSGNLTLVPTANIVFGGSGASRTMRITPAAGQTGSTFITIGVNDGTTTTTSILQLNVTAPAVTTVSDIANQTINEDAATPALAFTLGDTVVSPENLTVTGGSSNTTLVPFSNIVFGGSGASRTVTVTPSGHQFGTATITVTVGGGSSAASDSFVLTVNPVNDAPFIFSFPSILSIPRDTNTGDIIFAIGDLETAAASLTLTKSSDNLTLVPTANIVFGGSGVNRTVRITPAAGQIGSVFITIGVNDGTATSTSIMQLNVTAPAVTTVSDIANQTINEDAATPALNFTLGDTVVAPGSLTVTGGSSNTTLVPVSNIVFGGSGASRTVTVTPAANEFGTATITVTVGGGSSTASDSFVLTVNSVNDAPTISGLPNQTIESGTSTGLIALPIGDVDSPVASLVLTVGSNNQTLVPDANIVLEGGGDERALRITPAAGQTGVATIMVRVSDGALHADTFFNLTVEAVAADPLLVTTLVDENDQPAGRQISLREAVREAPAGATIRFSPLLSGLTIQLVDQILLDKAVHIDAGNLPGGIRVAGSGLNRIFQVTGGGVTGAIDITAATGSTATQSTDWFAGLYPASDGIDGDLGNFTHTLGAPEDSNPTWEVDFHRDVLLDRIRVHNRDSCCGERLSDITVTVLDANGFTIHEFAPLNPNNTLDAPEHLEVSLPGPVSARKVKVRRDPASTFGESSFLSIGELEVFLGVTLTRLTLVDGNEVSSVHGGGIFNEGTLTLVDCTLTRCRATTHGGALRNSGTLLLHRCTLSQNAAFYGSALFNDIDRVATLIQCTLADNTSGGGGAIYNQGVMDLSHCTIVGRWDLPGQRISNGPTGDLRLKNCIVTCNALSGCGPNIGVQRMDLINEGVVERLGANILLDYTDTNGGTSRGPDPIEAMARIAPLGDYGGPTPTCPPLPGSPALDMAVDSTETVNQRGFSRPIGAAADLGAAEYRPDLVVTTADDELDEPVGALLSLREAMRDAEPDARIVFAPDLSGQTLTLSRGELAQTKNLRIDALDLPSAFTISGNRASRIFNVNQDLSLTLAGLNLTQGHADFGGAIQAYFGALTLDHVHVVDNSAELGGGIYLIGTPFSASNSTFSQNSAEKGGGIICSAVNSNEIRFPLFTHCTFTGNSSGTGGGGIYAYDGFAYLRHCTLSGNLDSSGQGGGIFSTGDYFIPDQAKTWLSRCIVAGNGGGDLSYAGDSVYAFSSEGGNLIGLDARNGMGHFTQPGDRTGVTDPRLAPLGYHGGRTQTMPPLAGSPAIDPVGGLESSPFASDQRGYARVRDGEGNGTPVVDSGAVEAGTATWVDTTTDLTADDGQTTLREAIAAASEPGARVLFDPAVFPATISLSQGELTVDQSTFIDATGMAGQVGIDAGGASRIFTTAAGGILDISPATGSTVTQSSALNDFLYPASNALDGDLENFTHTDVEDPDPTWTVDFGRDIWIDTITLHNRVDCCPGRLSDITVRVYTGTEAPYQLVYQSPVLNPLDSLQGPSLLRVRLPAALAARRIEVKRDPASADEPGVLSLGEVQVSLDGGASIIGMTLVNGNGASARLSGQGGAILNLGSLDLHGCTVRNNTSPDQGGGLANHGTLRASGCLLANNVSAVSGGAIHTTGDDASLEITNSTLTQNRADGAGGGGVNHFSIGTTILTHCTVVGNQAPNGGGGGLRLAGSTGSFLLAHSIVAQNTAPTRPNLSSAIIETGANVIGGNPRLAPLADYGGPTLTMAPAIDSPARDASTNSTTRVDQRGFLRDNVPDLGAHEAGPAANYAAWIWESLPFNSTNGDRASGTDLDGDHATNREEYAMRTNPTLVTSVLKVSALTPTTLTFPSVLGVTYRLQSAPTLLPGGDTVWTDIGSGIAGTGSDITLDLPAGETGVVYRVRVGP